ncbi:MAG: hypothetical protein ACKO96_39690, partial [Flammeovirgaceae bacterium]
LALCGIWHTYTHNLLEEEYFKLHLLFLCKYSTALVSNRQLFLLALLLSFVSSPYLKIFIIKLDLFGITITKELTGKE